MPVIDGWEFLDEYDKLVDVRKAGVMVVMLSTSMNSEDMLRAESHSAISDFHSKPLEESAFMKVLDSYFSE